MQKKFFSVLLAFLLSSFPTTVSARAASDVHAVIPSYVWELDHREIDYQNSLYPPLNYKGVTYFPMTWGYCRLLGLGCVWVPDEGLFIANRGSYDTTMPTYEATRNPRTVTATLPTYPVYVNGKPIDNAREEYPLLNFRGVTYFPITWRFAREEFNWNTEWTENRFAVHWGIENDWGDRTDVYEQDDTAAYLVRYVSHSVPIGENENGDTVYTVQNMKHFYTLDFASGKLSAGVARPSYDAWAKGASHNLPVGHLPEGVSFRTDTTYLDESIPAPYTPFTTRAYVTVDGTDYLIGENITVTNVVRTPGFVFCNAQRYTGWKGWTNPNAELYRINLAEGLVERLDQNYEDYGSMKLLGCVNHLLYLKCQMGSSIYDGEGGTWEASPYHDGYYTMNPSTGELRLLRRFVYTDGDILSYDGHIYGIVDWKSSVERLY